MRLEPEIAVWSSVPARNALTPWNVHRALQVSRSAPSLYPCGLIHRSHRFQSCPANHKIITPNDRDINQFYGVWKCEQTSRGDKNRSCPKNVLLHQITNFTGIIVVVLQVTPPNLPDYSMELLMFALWPPNHDGEELAQLRSVSRRRQTTQNEGWAPQYFQVPEQNRFHEHLQKSPK